MKIDENAPVLGRATIEIAAEPQVVWDVIAGINEWPSWDPAVREASLDGELAEGSTFRWKAGSVTVRSTLRALEAPTLIAWTGRSLGLRAIHVYRVQPTQGGATVTTEESLDGWVAKVFRLRMTATLRAALESGLASLKAEAERRAVEA